MPRSHPSSLISLTGVKRSRLDDVAREAGVSKSIASRVLNGYDLPVRPETRDRVFETAERLKYRPHAGARALKREEARAIGMLVPDLANAAYARMVRGIFERAEECDFAVLLAEDQGDAAVPPFTTIRVPPERLGQPASTRWRSNSPLRSRLTIVIPVEPEVVIRASTALPATRAGRHNRQRKPRG